MGRPRDQREPARHLSSREVVHFATRGRRALRRENAEVIAVEGLRRTTRADIVAVSRGPRDEIAQRTA